MRVLVPLSLKSFLLNPHALELRRTGYNTTVWTNHYNGIYAAKYTTRFRAGPANAQLRNIRKEKTKRHWESGDATASEAAVSVFGYYIGRRIC